MFPGFAAIAIEHLGGAVGRVGPQETAFRHREAQRSLPVVRMWQDPTESDNNTDWARRCYRTAEPFLKGGVYVNYLGDEGNARVMAAYGSNDARLRDQAEVRSREFLPAQSEHQSDLTQGQPEACDAAKHAL